MTALRPFLVGAATAVGARALLPQLLLIKFRRDVAALNAGDYEPLLSAYADDAVLRFDDGAHRWAGEHRGKPAIARFLAEFCRAGVQGEIVDVWVAGAPWALSFVARFDDHADAADGERIYENRTALVLRTRWGRVVEHEDFYLDSSRIEAFEQRLVARGIAPLHA